MKEWEIIALNNQTHEPILMRLSIGQNCYIDLVDKRMNNAGKVKAVFDMHSDDSRLEKIFCKDSSCPLQSETKWAEDQVWNYLQEISQIVRDAQEALIPDHR